MPLPQPPEIYKPKDAIHEGVRCAAIGAASGLFFSAASNSLSRKNLGMMPVFTRTGYMIGFSSLAMGSLGFTLAASANLRQKDDHWNAAIAGAVGGAIAGMSHRRLPVIIGSSTALSVVLGVFQYTGGRFDAYYNRSEEDEFERKERLRANRRRPIEETIADVGEGRGICPPGYEERRRERIKEKYGFEVNPVKASVD